jgi:hypothetical protein
MPDPWPAETEYIVVHGDSPTDVRTGPFTLKGALSEQAYWGRYTPGQPTRIMQAVTTYTLVEQPEPVAAEPHPAGSR